MKPSTVEPANTIDETVNTLLGLCQPLIFCTLEDRSFYRGNGVWESEPVLPGESAGYGDIREIGARIATYVVPNYLSGSDYSGCSVERSNFRIVLEEHSETVVELFGGHGTYGIAIPLESFPSDLLDTIVGLDDYPAIDEGDMSMYEVDSSDESWECCYESDFRRLINGVLGRERDCDADITVEDEARWRQYFEDGRESVNCYWECETGGNMYVDIERVASSCTIESLRHLLAVGVITVEYW